MWLGEISSCSCLTALLGPARVLFTPSLYIWRPWLLAHRLSYNHRSHFWEPWASSGMSRTTGSLLTMRMWIAVPLGRGNECCASETRCNLKDVKKNESYKLSSWLCEHAALAKASQDALSFNFLPTSKWYFHMYPEVASSVFERWRKFSTWNTEGDILHLQCMMELLACTKSS